MGLTVAQISQCNCSWHERGVESTKIIPASNDPTKGQELNKVQSVRNQVRSKEVSVLKVTNKKQLTEYKDPRAKDASGKPGYLVKQRVYTLSRCINATKAMYTAKMKTRKKVQETTQNYSAQSLQSPMFTIQGPHVFGSVVMKSIIGCLNILTRTFN